MPFFNVLNDAMNDAVPTRAKPKPAVQNGKPATPPPKSTGKVRGPSTNPDVMRAVEAAKKRSEANLRKR